MLIQSTPYGQQPIQLLQSVDTTVASAFVEWMQLASAGISSAAQSGNLGQDHCGINMEPMSRVRFVFYGLGALVCTGHMVN